MPVKYYLPNTDTTVNFPEYTASTKPLPKEYGKGYATIDGVLNYSDGATWAAVDTNSQQGGSGTVTSVNTVLPDLDGDVTIVGSDISGVELTANKGSPNGYAGLTASGVIAIANLPVMGSAGDNHAAGMVPDPGDVYGTTKFLREDAQWIEPPFINQLVTSVAGKIGVVTLNYNDITGVEASVNKGAANGYAPLVDSKVPEENLPAFGASGVNHLAGLVPDPGAVAGTTKFLREDGTWSEVSGLVTSVAGKAGAVVLAITDVTGLSDAIGLKANTSDLGTAAYTSHLAYATASHTHTSSEITDLPDISLLYVTDTTTLAAAIADEVARIDLDPTGYTMAWWLDGMPIKVGTDPKNIWRHWDRTNEVSIVVMPHVLSIDVDNGEFGFTTTSTSEDVKTLIASYNPPRGFELRIYHSYDEDDVVYVWNSANFDQIKKEYRFTEDIDLTGISSTSHTTTITVAGVTASTGLQAEAWFMEPFGPFGVHAEVSADDTVTIWIYSLTGDVIDAGIVTLFGVVK